MLKIHAWGKNKPIFPAVISQIIAINPLTIHRYLAKVRTLGNVNNIPEPKSKLWLSFYRKNNRLKEKILLNLIENSLKTRLIKLLFDFYSKINEITADPNLDSHFKNQISINSFFKPILKFVGVYPEFSSESHPLLAIIYNFNIKLIKNDIENEKNPEIFENDDDQKIFTPEILFYLKVMFPCWIFYKEHHTFLLRKARQGEIESLEKVLRLDKNLLDDRLIRKQFIKSSQNEPLKHDVMAKAIKEKPKELSTLPKIKTSLAGLISVVSERLGHRFTASEIRELFNAVAVDYGRDELIDLDLPDSHEAFTKAIQRERPFWQASS